MTHGKIWKLHLGVMLGNHESPTIPKEGSRMARTAVRRQFVNASKAVAAVNSQHAKSGFNYDPSKNVLHFESDPIDVGHNGVYSVQVYSYDGGTPKIGIYRIGISKKTGQPWQVKETCPIDAVQALALSVALSEAAAFLSNLKVV